jgi:uncharacterized protein YbaR (Trm112 family)/SAM-dependent methyltransferase
MTLMDRYQTLRDRIREQAFLLSLDIRPGDTVLDIGSGNRPHPRADVLVERFFGDDTGRSGPALRDKSLVVGDAHRLPFGDQAFDFTIARHVIEHLDDPARFLAEIQRVSRAGYIEAPSEVSEKLHGYAFHKWFVSLDGQRLTLKPKPQPVFDPYLANTLGRLNHLPGAYRRFCSSHPELFLVRLKWSAQIEFEVEGNGPEDSVEGFEVQQQSADAAAELRNWIKQGVKKPQKTPALGRLARLATRMKQGKGNRRALEKLLACPGCRGVVVADGDTLVCASCLLRYPVVEGIPVMLAQGRLT